MEIHGKIMEKPLEHDGLDGECHENSLNTKRTSVKLDGNGPWGQHPVFFFMDVHRRGKKPIETKSQRFGSLSLKGIETVTQDMLVAVELDTMR